jgi:hypothetical protein
MSKNPYYKLDHTIGRNSPLAVAEHVRLNQIATNIPEVSNFTQNDLYRMQDELFVQKSIGVLTDEDFDNKLAELSQTFAQAQNYQIANQRLADFPLLVKIDTFANHKSVSNLNRLLKDLNAPQNHDENQGAPFNEYYQNSDQLWKCVDDRIVRRFLQTRLFMAAEVLYDMTNMNIQSDTRLQTTDSTPIFEVPTKLIVNASGFSSWLGREDSFGNQGMGEKNIAVYPYSQSTSYIVSKAYAGHPADPPPLTSVEVYIQPDGIAFASNSSGGGDSHRIVAAILRGTKAIKTSRLNIVLLKDSLYSK